MSMTYEVGNPGRDLGQTQKKRLMSINYK